MARIITWGKTPRRRRFTSAGCPAALFFVLLIPLRARAQSGGQPGEFLTYGVGARALSMGGAYYGISDDATASDWNPAGLAQINRKQFTAMESSLFYQTNMTFIGYAQPLKNNSTIALGYTQLASNGFQTVNAVFDPNTGQPTSLTTGGSFNEQDTALSLSWGKFITKTMAFGATVQDINRKLAGSSDSSQSINLGAMKIMGPYHLGLGLQNAFSRTGGDTQDHLPVTIILGNALYLFRDRLVLDMDGYRPLTGAFDLRFGGEFWVTRWFAARFGLRGLPALQETDFGFGFDFHSIGIDIGEGLSSALGTTTRVSATLRFGLARGEKSNAQVQAFLKRGFAAFQEGDFALASEKFNQALDVQPGNAQVQAMLSRLMSVTTFIPQAMGGQDYQKFIRKGVSAYVDGRDLRESVNDLRYAYNKNSKDSRLLALLNMVEKEAGIADITRKPIGPEQLTWVEEKIYDARQSMYNGRYDQALRRTQDVLDLEPDNVTALEIMGSAFYMMNQKDKALAVWKKALEINPKDATVKNFLNSMK
ncbi:MAG: tetratricopeptide repeat protein [Elusimicrobiota bacterium]